MLSLGSRITAIAIVCLVGSTGIVSTISPFLPLPAVHHYEGHRSSLRATVTMADGTTRTITLQGVPAEAGCVEGKVIQNTQRNF